jgi:hypothetical protein
VNGERNPTVEPDNEAKYLRMSGWGFKIEVELGKYSYIQI